MSLEEMVKVYILNGYNIEEAKAKVCQDLILIKISKSSFKNNITIKGGIVMHSISNDIRRATKDIDIDFIKYSLSNKSIENFIFKLNNINDNIKINIIKDIEELKQQNYHGKRVYIKLTDNNNFSIDTKLDIGVENNFDKNQEEYCFNFELINTSAKLLINSKEQILVEKLIALLKFGSASTRYKDILDIYYLINCKTIDNNKFIQYIDTIIFKNEKLDMRNINDIYDRLNIVFNKKIFIKKFVNNKKNNWLELPVDVITNNILLFIKNLEKIEICN